VAGRRSQEVFLATDTTRAGHQVFRSTDGGQSCPTDGIPDSGDVAGHHYDGNGKLLYDPAGDRLAEPITFDDGLGASAWNRGDAAFTPHKVYTGSTYAHWPVLVQDGGGTLYLVWDTNPRIAGTTLVALEVWLDSKRHRSRNDPVAILGEGEAVVAVVALAVGEMAGQGVGEGVPVQVIGAGDDELGDRREVAVDGIQVAGVGRRGHQRDLVVGGERADVRRPVWPRGCPGSSGCADGPGSRRGSVA
jgi:hypothetical protein